MKILFSLLGITLGLWASFNGFTSKFSNIAIIGAILLILSFRKGAHWPFLAFLASGMLIGLIKLPDAPKTGVFQGIVIESKDNYFIFLSSWRRYYVYGYSHPYQVGDILSIDGSSSVFAATTYESRFSFVSYLASKGVNYEISGKISPLFQLPFRLKEYEDSFISSFGSDAKGLISSLLFNRKDYQNSAVSTADELSLLSLFSTSGIIYSLLLRGYRRILNLKLSDKATKIAVLLTATLFLPFTYSKLGILRVYFGVLIGFFNEFALKKRFDRLEIISLTGFALILLDRHSVLQTGFLLGMGVAIFQYFSRNVLERTKPRWKTLATSAAIYLFILPSHISMSGGLHLLSFLFNVLSIPLIAPFAAISSFSFGVHLPLTAALNSYGSFLRLYLNFLSSIDIFVPLPSLSTPLILLYYLIYIGAMYLLEVGFHAIKAIAPICYLSIYLISLFPLPSLVYDQVSFINVGQGDSILIRDGFTTVMIDTGGNLSFDMAKESLIPYLLNQRIYHIDYLIASHGDFDHIGAKDSLMKNFRVNNYVELSSSFPLDIGNLHIENYNVYSETGENESSLVLSLYFMDKNWLFTGDAPIEIEKKIIEDYPSIDCDILKVGHHGSSTSTCEEWLDAVTPEEAVISVGAKNKYGHPDKKVLQRLTKHNVKIRRTDLEGTITYKKGRYLSI